MGIVMMIIITLTVNGMEEIAVVLMSKQHIVIYVHALILILIVLINVEYPFTKVSDCKLSNLSIYDNLFFSQIHSFSLLRRTCLG